MSFLAFCREGILLHALTAHQDTTSITTPCQHCKVSSTCNTQLHSCFMVTTLHMAWHPTCLPAMQASSWPHHSIQLIPAQPEKACWHCSQACAFCWKGNLSAAPTPPQLRCTTATHYTADQGAVHATHNCTATGVHAVSRLQHTTAFNPSKSKSESGNTTALKVPGRSLSRVLVEPNPV